MTTLHAAAAAPAGFALAMSLLVAIGPQNLHVLNTGLARRHIGATVLLCIGADALLLAAALAGAAPALGEATAVRWIACVLLCVCAWRSLRDGLSPSGVTAGHAAKGGLRSALASTAVVTFGNPAVYVETLLLVGGTGAQLDPAARVGFGAGALAASAVWFSLLGYGAQGASRWLGRPAVQRTFALASAAVMTSMAWDVAYRG